MISGRTIREANPSEFHGLSYPQEKVADRVVKIGGRRSRTTWRYRIDPPTRYAYETQFENGSFTRFENTYAPAEGGTQVTTVGEVTIKRVPSFLLTWLVSRSLSRTDDEDLAYARKMNL